MSKGFEKAICGLLEGLVNEKASCIQTASGQFMADLFLTDAKDTAIQIHFSGSKNPFSSEVEIHGLNDLTLNRKPIRSLTDLTPLGLNDNQIHLLKQNIEATDYLEEIYNNCNLDKKQPSILGILSANQNMATDNTLSFASLLSQLPGKEAFVLSDTCGNIDGSTANPLKNVMFGEVADAIHHHPVPTAFYDGTAKIHLVKLNDCNHIHTAGQIPDRLTDDFLYHSQSQIFPVNTYSLQDMRRIGKNVTVVDTIDAFTLLSKRSFIPVHGDYQLKTSFPAQITSEKRMIDWPTARSTIESSRILTQLIQQGHVSDSLWALPTFYAAQQAGFDHSTFYIRGGFQDALNRNQTGLPDDVAAITACSLTNRNLVSTDETLFESLVKFGFDPLSLFSAVTHAILNMQLDFITMGWIPDAHTQNIAYLLDFKRKNFRGLLLKDAECEKIDLQKMSDRGIACDATQLDDSLLRERKNLQADEKLFTLYLHHTIYSKHITPLAQILWKKYAIPLEKISHITHNTLIEWLDKNPQSDIRSKIDFSGRYYERNLACKTLSIGPAPHYRLINGHTLIPSL